MDRCRDPFRVSTGNDLAESIINDEMFVAARRARRPVTMLPANWWHHVVAEEPSITLSFEFVTEQNFGIFLAEIFRHLPDVVGRFLSDDQSREALGLQWRSKGFETVSGP